MCADRKPKSKKKAKKAKFKSLKKGDLAFETKMKKEQLQAEPMSTDDEFVCPGEVAWSDIMSPRLTRKEKRKKVEAAEDAQDDVSKKFKKIKKVAPETKLSKLGKQRDESRVLKSPETKCPELKTASRGKVAGKLSITPAPIKREMTIRTEKLKKKGSVWSKDFFPSDTWLSQEDAILCAVVHEYGPHWSLVSEILYGMTAGGFYRGRYRHPVHCCERYRELIQRYILSTVYHLHNEKVNNASFGKAPLKVTEDNLRMLLKTASELPDGEMLLQKHFTALLSAIWRVGFRSNSPQNYSSRNSSKSRILFHANQTSGSFFKESPGQMDYMNPWKNRKLLAAALNDVDMKKWEDRRSKSSDMEDTQVIPEQIEVTLEFLNENDEWSVPLPASLNMTIYGSDIHSDILKPMEDKNAIKSSPIMAEDRFRVASIACIEGGLDWASSAFPIYGIKSRLTNKSQTLGKHKLPMSDSIMKPSKSKLKRVPMESDSMPQLNSEILFQMRPVAANESNLSIPDVGFNDDDFLSLANEEPPMEAKTGSMVQHHYIPGFISDLDDCSLSQDYSDFG